MSFLHTLLSKNSKRLSDRLSSVFIKEKLLIADKVQLAFNHDTSGRVEKFTRRVLGPLCHFDPYSAASMVNLWTRKYSSSIPTVVQYTGEEIQKVAVVEYLQSLLCSVDSFKSHLIKFSLISYRGYSGESD